MLCIISVDDKKPRSSVFVRTVDTIYSIHNSYIWKQKEITITKYVVTINYNQSYRLKKTHCKKSNQ